MAEIIELRPARTELHDQIFNAVCEMQEDLRALGGCRSSSGSGLQVGGKRHGAKARRGSATRRKTRKEHAKAFSDPYPHLQGRIQLEVWKQETTGRFELLKVYPICRWSGDLGPKITEATVRHPRAFYTITPGLMNPNSNYLFAINTGFPNAYDRANDRHGGFLMIHGDCSSRGCYAMTDEQIGEIYSLARIRSSAVNRHFRSKPIRSA